MKRIQKSQNKLEVDFKTYLKATASRTTWFGHINKQIIGQGQEYMERKEYRHTGSTDYQ